MLAFEIKILTEVLSHAKSSKVNRTDEGPALMVLEPRGGDHVNR